MGFFDIFRTSPKTKGRGTPRAAGSESGAFISLDDPRAIEFLRDTGADNAGHTSLLEGDTEYKPIGANAKDAQMNELRKLQVEEIGRVSGVPRPLLMVDETSWGSG